MVFDIASSFITKVMKYWYHERRLKHVKGRSIRERERTRESDTLISTYKGPHQLDLIIDLSKRKLPLPTKMKCTQYSRGEGEREIPKAFIYKPYIGFIVNNNSEQQNVPVWDFLLWI